MNETFKGYCLFNDIENEALRNRNRATVLANIANDHTKNRLITPNGAGLVLGYFQCIPKEERNEVKNLFADFMAGRGYVLAGS